MALKAPRQDLGQVQAVRCEPFDPGGRHELGPPGVGHHFEPAAELVQEPPEHTALVGRGRPQLLVHLGKA